jgi:alpha-beta hydrolase superfamily lysophospholipase
MNRKSIVILTVIILGIIISLFVFHKTRTGIDRFFVKDQEYHYMTLRVMGDAHAGGAEAGEVLSIISRIPEGNDEQWFSEWNKAGLRLENKGNSITNPVSRGYVFLRAHCYYRNAEFFMSPNDPRRLPAFRKGRDIFYRGLDSLGVAYKEISIPYGKYKLRAVYYPAVKEDPAKPLILTCGGFDSTLEEQYFLFIKAIRERGYSCLAFEGPGQGSVIREQGLPFTHEWEKPTKAVLDEFLKRYPKPAKIIMLGSSLGGNLVPRAAAFENRIDGVVAFGGLFDFGETARRKIPAVGLFLLDNGYRGIVNSLIKFKMRLDTTMRWAMNHSQWVLGVDSPVDVVAVAMPKFNLADVAGKIHCPVLIVTGEKDHLVPVEQIEKMKKSMVNAKSVTVKIFNAAEGGAEHCQMGAFSLFYEELFDWLEKSV